MFISVIMSSGKFNILSHTSLLSYRTLDTDGNGYLDFKEFIMANDLIAARTKEEKLSWAFKV